MPPHSRGMMLLSIAAGRPSARSRANLPQQGGLRAGRGFKYIRIIENFGSARRAALGPPDRKWGRGTLRESARRLLSQPPKE